MCPPPPAASLLRYALHLLHCLAPQVLVHGHNGLLPKLDMYYLLRYFFHGSLPAAHALWQEKDAAWLHARAELAAWDQVREGGPPWTRACMHVWLHSQKCMFVWLSY